VEAVAVWGITPTIALLDREKSPRWAMYVECNIVACLSNHYCHGNAKVVDVHVAVNKKC